MGQRICPSKDILVARRNCVVACNTSPLCQLSCALSSSLLGSTKRSKPWCTIKNKMLSVSKNSKEAAATSHTVCLLDSLHVVHISINSDASLFCDWTLGRVSTCNSRAISRGTSTALHFRVLSHYPNLYFHTRRNYGKQDTVRMPFQTRTYRHIFISLVQQHLVGINVPTPKLCPSLRALMYCSRN
jgi:hypothetical protein